MPSHEDLFLKEIFAQPEALRAVADTWLDDATIKSRLWQAIGEGRPSLVVFTGMGSSIDAAYPACAFLNRSGVPAVVVETSELLHYGIALVESDALLVVVTQSGESAEPVRLVRELAEGRTVLSVTNGVDNTVARASTVAFDLGAGPEQTVSTKTYVATLAALASLAHALIDADLRALGPDLDATIEALEEFLKGWEREIAPLEALARECPHLVLVARGPSLATAHEAALILGEAAHRQAVAISGGHFRHGPIELVGPDRGYILFPGDTPTRELVLRLGGDIARHGGKVVYVGEEPPDRGPDWIGFPKVHRTLAPILEIVPIQLLAWSIAHREGRTVDGFDKLTKVTRTE